jgi:hypothetical protein
VTDDHLTKLAKIRIEEISGVDLPANLLDGWMVQKARASGERLFHVHVGDRSEVCTLSELRTLDAAVVSAMEEIEKSITLDNIIANMSPDQLDAVLIAAAREQIVQTRGEAQAKAFDRLPHTPIRNVTAPVETEKAARHSMRHRYSGKFIKPSEAEATMTSGVLPGEARRGKSGAETFSAPGNLFSEFEQARARKKQGKQGRALWGSSGLGVAADGPPVQSGGSLSSGYGDQGAT